MVIDRLYPLLDRLARPQARWIIIGLHLLLLAVLFVHQGILTDKEALKYTGCAEAVLHGDLRDLTGNYLKYGTYVLFLVPFVAVGKAGLAILVQILIGLVAADALARMTERITHNVGLGQLAMAVFLLCPLIQTWTLALYTEHFFTCMAILFLERIMCTTRLDGIAVLLGFITLFARPVGLFFVVPALLWKWSARTATGRKAWLVPVSCSALYLFAITVPHVELPQLQPIAAGQVIAGVGGLATEDLTGHTIGDAQRYLLQHTTFGEWASIFIERTLSLFTLTRPHYSALHNALNATLYLLYPFALVGLWKFWSDPRTRTVAVILLMNALLVGITHDEWSGRFLVPLLPWVILLAVLGLKKSAASRPGM